jgi:hypothetical protein
MVDKTCLTGTEQKTHEFASFRKNNFPLTIATVYTVLTARRSRSGTRIVGVKFILLTLPSTTIVGTLEKAVVDSRRRELIAWPASIQDRLTNQLAFDQFS